MFSQVTQTGSVYQIPPALEQLQWCKVLPETANDTSVYSNEDVNVDRLLPTLVECFAIVFFGFIAGKCNIISVTDIKGLNDFITYFSLPPLIFLNLVTINFSNVNWSFILSVFVGKIIVFVLVAMVTASASRSTNLAYAGIYGIFCTQGNDFGLAYPIIASLYGSRKPLYAGYMYLIAPTSLLFLNPMGFILMEAQNSRNKSNQDQEKKGKNCFATFMNVLWNIGRNPVVLVTILGVFGNYLFKNGVPSVLFGILQILSSAFSAGILFLLGFCVARASDSNFPSKEGLLIPSVLLMTKMLVSPVITRSCVSLLCAGAGDIDDLADYGFLYGMVPTGPIVMLFAAEYGLRTEMMASTMVVCTGLFGPVVYVLARMLSLKVKGIGEFADELRMTMLVLSILSFFSCVWIGLSFIAKNNYKKQICKITYYLVLAQIIMTLGVFIWSVRMSGEVWMVYFEITLMSAGQLMTKMWVTVLSVTLLLLRRNPECSFVKSMWWACFLGIGVPLFIVILLLTFTAIGECIPELDNALPLFIYGKTEALASIFILLTCLTITVCSLILYFRTPSKPHPQRRQNVLDDTDNKAEKHTKIDMEKEVTSDNILIDSATLAIGKMKKPETDFIMDSNLMGSVQCRSLSTDKYNPDDCPWSQLQTNETSFKDKNLMSDTESDISSVMSSPSHSSSTSPLTRCDETRHQTHLRHVIFLIISCISMAVGLTVSTWKLSTNQPNGLFVAMEFLDAVLLVGQGLFLFLVFIKDSKYLLKIISKWCKKVRHGFYSLDANVEMVDQDILFLCTQFNTYHRDNCMRDLPRTFKKNNELYDECFTGNDFVDWVLKVGLATCRTAAENYGQRLYRGGVLATADGAVQFHDNIAYVYTLNAFNEKSIEKK